MSGRRTTPSLLGVPTRPLHLRVSVSPQGGLPQGRVEILTDSFLTEPRNPPSKMISPEVNIEGIFGLCGYRGELKESVSPLTEVPGKGPFKSSPLLESQKWTPWPDSKSTPWPDSKE